MKVRRKKHHEKKVSVTVSQDLFEHIEALKIYYGYNSKSEVVEKALDEFIRKYSNNVIFLEYLHNVRENMKKEMEE